MKIFQKNKIGVDIEQQMMIINQMILVKILEMVLKVLDKIQLKIKDIRKKNQLVNKN